MDVVSWTKNRAHGIVSVVAITVTLLLVAYPILRAYIPGPFWAKWMLAYAANERVAGRIDNALGALDQSYERDPGIVYDAQYWQTRLNIVFGKSPVQDDEVERLVEHAIASMRVASDVQRRSRISMYLASNLLQKQYWDLAIDVMEVLFDVPQRRAPEQNNLLAYSRSLSMTNLKQALVEIDLALQRDTHPAYLDTKGWVLYQLGDYEAALTFSDRAVNEYLKKVKETSPKLYELLTRDPVPIPSIGIPKLETVDEEEEKMKESEPTKKRTAAGATELVQIAKDFATVRFHRARILEGLGRKDEAEQDLAWIKSLGIEDYSELY